ncbi:fumarylacetoacetate hydrolase family protein [Alkalicoccus saliphilus]|jgi:acylpyruvate hydrolase|uniref:FAA hydrolase family protein n=1 Tax=Alkalicoccus saliphilus TaxID=200989 RepID=A0A2T4U3S2_9BACI|nr:fumarylacetoacetate hydrolase family protein [Alkalicoccus saliphilus]PTL38005.1 FAA hydrolase family protein [Alkalicoccus saliphilus]
MKLVTFLTKGKAKVGVVEDNQVIDLHESYKAHLKHKGETRIEEKANAFVPNNMNELLEGGEESLKLAKEAVFFALEAKDQAAAQLVYKKADVKIGAPVPKPNKIVCVGHNYRDHIKEMGRDLPEVPVLFAKFSNAVIGPEDDIPHPSITEKLDYEAEFAFVVGKKAKDVSEEEALDYVAGYTIVNDVSARDLQMRTLQWLQGKSMDGSAPMGPWLVTKDEIADPDALDISLKVNGVEKQRSNTEQLVFNVNRMLSFTSSIMTLEPGDVILTGTPGGVGVARDPQEFLKDGDVVTIEVGEVGVLENTVRKV